MNTLEKILSEDPLKIRDDDHPERKDISPEEFKEGLNSLVKKYNLKFKKEFKEKSDFSEGIIEAMNSVK